MEGVWFAYDAQTGQPIYQRVKVIDRTEHPPLQPGKPVAVYPSSLGGLNYSPASYDRTRTTSSTPRPRPPRSRAGEALADAEEAQAPARRHLPRAANGNFGTRAPGLARPRLDQRDRRQHRQAGLEVRDARAGARRCLDHRQRARLRRRRRRQPARVRPQDGQGALDLPDRPPDRGGPAIYSVDGKEYIAITSGGTPTSSNGGIASELQIFALGGSFEGSSPPPSAARPAVHRAPARCSCACAGRAPRRAARLRQHPDAGRARRETVGCELVERRARATGRVLLNGAPVAGAPGCRSTRIGSRR